ncbi:MAG: PilT/PilU family type 4a pilus ATPase [Myxococcota bacterium]
MTDDFDPFADVLIGPAPTTPPVAAPHARAPTPVSTPASWGGAPQPARPTSTPPRTMPAAPGFPAPPHTPAPVLSAPSHAMPVATVGTPAPQRTVSAGRLQAVTAPPTTAQHNAKDVLDQLLGVGVSHGASDIHLIAGSPARYRMKGALMPIQGEPLPVALTASMAEHVLSSHPDRRPTGETHDVDTSYSIPGVSRFRVSILRQRGSLGLIFRVIRSEVLTIEQLTLPPQVRELAGQDKGLVVICGQGGSGRSTTLAAVLEEMNIHRPISILTLEDPIEFLLKSKQASVIQREVGTDTRSLEVGLKQAMRQDPDVIAMGELTDATGVDLALSAVESGRLVLCTATGTEVVKVLQRLIGFYPPDEQPVARARLSDALRAVVFQRLVRSTQGSGRIAACEILRATPKVAEYIRDPARFVQLGGLIREGEQERTGSLSLETSLATLVRARMVETDAAMAVANRPADLHATLEG